MHNYEPGDALYLFGFSRGAYTVRSLAGLIRNCGILRREHAEKVGRVYSLYRNRGPVSAPGREKSVECRKNFAVADVSRIHFVGVFDTVGALGIPAPFLGTLGTDRYLFHDTAPSSIINHTRHAVSIDDMRQDFEPPLWSPKAGIDLRQVWFAGVHTDIGGGYPDYAGRQHNEYKGFYKALGRKHVRVVEPVLHVSVGQRWEGVPVKYKSLGLIMLIDRVGWSGITVVGKD